MTDAEIRRGLAMTTLRADLHQFQALRFARLAYQQHGAAFLERMADSYQLDDVGRLRPVGPATDHARMTVGSELAGALLAARYLDQGLSPDEVKRAVMGRIRTLSRAWPGSEYDRIERLKAYRKGMRRTLAGAGQE